MEDTFLSKHKISKIYNEGHKIKHIKSCATLQYVRVLDIKG